MLGYWKAYASHTAGLATFEVRTCKDMLEGERAYPRRP